MDQSPRVGPMLEHLTSQVRRILGHTETEPVGVLTAYRDAILKLADAVDRLANEIDSRTKPR
jgi:hypothetical protein